MFCFYILYSLDKFISRAKLLFILGIMGKKIILSLVLSCILTAEFALAYIDPGTGMVIGGSIWPFILAIFAAIGGFFLKFFKPIKEKVASVCRKRKN